MEQVQRLVESGAQPLELYYQSVISAEFKAPAAYRSQLRISNPDLGVLLPEQYLPVALRTTQSLDLAYWNLGTLLSGADSLCDKGAEFDFLSMYAPVRFLMKTDMAAKVARMLSEREFLHPEKIVFEFPEELLYEDMEEASPRMEAVRELGVKTAVTGFGSEFSPVMRLANLKVDYVITDSYVLHQLEAEKTSSAAASLVNFALETGASVIMDGADEAFLDTAYRYNVYGVTGRASGRYKKLSTLLKQA